MLIDTRLRIDWPTMMLVAFDDAMSKPLARVLDAAMFKVVREPSLAAACENMLVSMPHVIVIGQEALSAAEHSAFADRATGIGAEVVVLSAGTDADAARRHLCAAADRSLARRAG